MKIKKIFFSFLIFVFIFMLFSCSNKSSSQTLSSIVDVSNIKTISISRLIDSQQHLITETNEIQKFIETNIDVKWTDEEEKVNLVTKEFDTETYQHLNISFSLNDNSYFIITIQQEGYAYLNINGKKYTIDGEEKIDYKQILNY